MMAAIVDDGLRVWAADTVNRKLGRLLAVVVGATMLDAVYVIEPGRGWARPVCALFAGVFFLYAVRPPRQPPHHDIVRLEAAVDRLTEQFELHEDFAGVHVDEVRDLISDIRAQVR